MAPNTKQTIEKAAYTAVGAPIAAVKAVGARVGEIREALMASGSDLSEDLAKEFDTWVAEGERVVKMALDRLRNSGAIDRARSTTQMVKDRIEVSIDEMSDTLDIVEPENSIGMINGIGPSTSKRLTEIGVSGIAAFLGMTSTQRRTEELAAASGYSAETLAGWRAQADLTRVNGVGDDYRRLLHRMDIWTMDQLAKANAGKVSSDMASLDIPGMPEHLPSETQLKEWIAEAKKLMKS